MNTTTLRLFAVTVLFISFAGYNFIRAYDESVWFPPDPGTPPAHNVAIPINTGSSSQVKNGPLSVDTLLSTGEIVGSKIGNSGQFRLLSGSYGVLLRNDDVNTYLLLTKKDDELGTWNTLRPLYINNSTGLITMKQGLSVNAGNIKVNGQVNATKFCDQGGQHCLNLSACHVGDSLVLKSSGDWGCSSPIPAPAVDYASYIKNNCGLTVPNPGSYSLNAVLMKDGTAYDIYDKNSAYSLLAWSCNGPDSAVNSTLIESCGFSVTNPGTVSLNGVKLKNGSFYDFYDSNSATAILNWSCASPDAAISSLNNSCGLSVPNPGSVSLNNVKLQNGSYYDFYDSNSSTASLAWSCQ